MRIKETDVSRRTQLLDLLHQFCPDLDMGSAHKFWIHYNKRRLLAANIDHKLSILSQDGELFKDGEWSNIRIKVLDKKYFERAVKFAKAYEQLNQRTAEIVKIF